MVQMDGSAREHLAVALDVPDLEGATALIGALDGAPGWLKIGSELFTAAGPAAIAAARGSARVFLDLKFHDIPHTVARAVGSATRHGAALLTLHAAGGGEMLRAGSRSERWRSRLRGSWTWPSGRGSTAWSPRLGRRPWCARAPVTPCAS
jgi:orotidine-5'-phosphate decarboxylase